MNVRIALPPIDLAELDNRAVARRRAQREAIAEPGRFNAISLVEWLPRIAAAGVPHIPAETVFELAQDVWLHFDAPEEQHWPVWEGLHNAVASVPSSHMVRWDFCASLSLKGALARAKSPADSLRDLSPDDPRAFDILYEYPRETVPVLCRPWVPALHVDGYPVEFRAFVRESKVIAVASYYPQRPLCDSPQMRTFVSKVQSHSATIVDYLSASGQYPWLLGFERQFKAGTVNATLDFLVREDGEVVFIEAGPPFGAGAHPCAFLGRDEIAGVALALSEGVELF